MSLERFFTDEELVQALVHDVVGAFPKLMEIYDQHLYRLIMSQVKDHDLAEEIVQESWIRVYQALQRYAPEKIQTLELRSWLFTIVQNEMKTQLRKKNASNSLSTEELKEELVDDVARSPEEIAELKNQVAITREVIAQMPLMARTILTLYFFHELSYQEIADQQGLTVGNVRTHVSHGLRELRKKLAAVSN